MKILYLHDFGESARNQHYEILHRLFPEVDIATEEVDYTEKPILDLIFDLECIRDADYIVGVGYGGFLAYLSGIINKTPTVLINPYIPAETHLDEIPYIIENKQAMISFWENNKGQNKDCHIIIDGKTLDADKIFNEFKDIAKICICCDSDTLINSPLYESWLKDTIV